MGYAVYNHGDRWAGYGVPAECDWPDCREKIDRGLGYKCEDHGGYKLILNREEISYDRFDEEDDAEEEWVETEGCGLFFCEKHRSQTDQHANIEPKPDTQEWIDHMLTDESWQDWRNENLLWVASANGSRSER